MGAYSEMDMELKAGGEAFAGDDPFTEDGDQCTDGTVADVSSKGTPQAEDDPFTEDDPCMDKGAADVADEGAAEDTSPAAQPTPDDGAVKEDDEDARRKAHEEAEKKRKAEWDAEKKRKKAAEKLLIAQIDNMSDSDVMAASMKRVSEDTEKLTRRNMKECVAEYIQTKCLDDPAFARRVMHPRKSMVHCIWYINRKAREFVQQEMKDNDIKPENGIYGSDVPDDLCYQWAEDYFTDPDAQEDKEKAEKFVPKPYRGKTTPAPAKPKTVDKADGGKAAATQAAEPKKPEEKPDDGGQITFGDFAMPEEKAG